MDFARLKSSIELNAGEKPSVYMALCMVESLFKDVEDAIGADISRADPGDETLPTKMIWLSRKLLKIYDENSEALERNRNRLDDMMAKLKQTDRVLSDLAAANERYQMLQREQSAMTDRMAEAEKRRAACEALQAELNAANARLQQLSAADPEAMQARITQTQEAANTLAERNRTVAAQLQQTEQRHAALQAEQAQLEQRNRQAEAMLAQLEQRNSASRSEMASLRESAGSLEAELRRLTKEHDEAVLLCAHYTERNEQARQELLRYRAENVTPLQTESEALQKEQADLSAQRNAAMEQLAAARKDREDAVLKTALLGQELQRARAALEERRSAMKQLEGQKQGLDRETDRIQQQISAQTERLAALQDENRALEQEKLPMLTDLTEKAAARQKELTQQLAEMEQKKTELTEDSAQLEQKHAEQSRELDALNATHSALTAAYATSSAELQKLRQQLEELRGKNDKEKAQRYRQQLKDEITELEGLKTECADLEKELVISRNTLEEQQARTQKLKEQKQALDEASQKIAVLLRDLSPYAAPEMLERTRFMSLRLQTLETASESLKEAMHLLRKVLGLRTDRTTDSAEDLGEQLQLYGKSLDRLQKAMLKCADGIQMEEQ